MGAARWFQDGVKMPPPTFALMPESDNVVLFGMATMKALGVDMYQIALKWTEFVPKVHAQYPYLLAEMYAFCIAAAHLKLRHQLIDSLMASNPGTGGEAWPLVDKIPPAEMCEFARHPDHSKYALPSVIHLCQRYSVGDVWFFGKRRIPHDIYACETPLFAEPPADLALLYDFKKPPNANAKSWFYHHSRHQDKKKHTNPTTPKNE